jgi:Fe-S oxidoreductase
MLVEEFLLREARDAILRIAIHHQPTDLPPARPKILLHAHCHQQAQSPAADGGPYGSGATLELLELCGFKVELSEGGCCGMGGTFGFEAEHYDLSMKIGELSLFPQIRSIVRDNGGLSEGGAAGAGAVVAATGGACRLQILHGTGARVVHPLVLVRDALFAQT